MLVLVAEEHPAFRPASRGCRPALGHAAAGGRAREDPGARAVNADTSGRRRRGGTYSGVLGADQLRGPLGHREHRRVGVDHSRTGSRNRNGSARRRNALPPRTGRGGRRASSTRRWSSTIRRRPRRGRGGSPGDAGHDPRRTQPPRWSGSSTTCTGTGPGRSPRASAARPTAGGAATARCRREPRAAAAGLRGTPSPSRSPPGRHGSAPEPAHERVTTRPPRSPAEPSRPGRDGELDRPAGA